MGADFHDIRYVRIGSNDLDESIGFATRILGLELVRRDANAAYLRGDDRDHNIVYVRGRDAGHVVGYELKSMTAIDDAAAMLDNAGVRVTYGTAEACEQRCVRGLITVQDPTGNVIDLVAKPHASGKRYFPGRDAGITHFSHVGMHTANAAIDEAFWVNILGAKVSDWIGDAALLRINEVHHNLALFPSKQTGIQHVNFQVEGVDDIMKSYYFLLENNVNIVFGPGRHATSGARFLYFQGPDKMTYEYSCGVRMITAEDEKTYQPRQFPTVPSSYCVWGSKPDIAEFKSDDANLNHAA